MLSINMINSTVFLMGNDSLENIKLEEYNAEYEGFTFYLFHQVFRSRLAKKTAKKRGYFVVFWTKDVDGTNVPFSHLEQIDKTIVSVIDDKKVGQFIFPKKVLIEKGIIRSDVSKGKMAIRVYPTWEINLNETAKRSQKWQSEYFIDMSEELLLNDLKRLYYE